MHKLNLFLVLLFVAQLAFAQNSGYTSRRTNNKQEMRNDYKAATEGDRKSTLSSMTDEEILQFIKDEQN